MLRLSWLLFWTLIRASLATEVCSLVPDLPYNYSLLEAPMVVKRPVHVNLTFDVTQLQQVDEISRMIRLRIWLTAKWEDPVLEKTLGTEQADCNKVVICGENATRPLVWMPGTTQ